MALLSRLNLTLGTLVSSLMVSYVRRNDELKSDVAPARAAWLERQRWITVAIAALSTARGAFLLMLIGQPVWRLQQHARTQGRTGRLAE